jgi:hypothetical protein
LSGCNEANLEPSRKGVGDPVTGEQFSGAATGELVVGSPVESHPAVTVPHGIRFVDSIRRSAADKTLRRSLYADYLSVAPTNREPS